MLCSHAMSEEGPLTNYVAYQDAETQQRRIGHLDFSNEVIIPLSFVSGTPIVDLYQVIEAGEANICSADDHIPVSSVKILPPLVDRDVLCVGKNYAEHAKEFNSSGFDSSDKVDTPSHPVIFTKRWTSIIADGEDIFPHPEFTQTLDYEGEIGTPWTMCGGTQSSMTLQRVKDNETTNSFTLASRPILSVPWVPLLYLQQDLVRCCTFRRMSMENCGRVQLLKT